MRERRKNIGSAAVFEFCGQRQTDGLGGFASHTFRGTRTRRYHALLLVSRKPPTDRRVLVNGVDVVVDDTPGVVVVSGFDGVRREMARRAMEKLINELLKAGADTAAFENGRYDAVTIAAVGRLSHRLPPAHWVSWGLALLALSFALMPWVHPAAGLSLLWVLVILGRVGLGFILPSLNLGALRGLPKELIPQASSVIGFVRMLGGAAGVSICAIVLEWRLAVYAQASGISDRADLRAFNETFVFLASITALALLAAWKMGEARKIAKKD
jgi:hypothetical protein